MRGVASTAPAVVAARIASATHRIRVGAGGVMLPNHSPVVVAEEFGTLECFHPGRIDLGLGRALGGPRDVADRVRGPHERAATPFADRIAELIALFDADGDRPAAVPAAGNRPEIWLLGSSDHTARIAGDLGLPFAAAHHLTPMNTVEATGRYLDCFRPSAICPTPRISISVSVIVATNAERAHWLAGSLRMKTARRRQGEPMRLPAPDVAADRGFATPRHPGDEPPGLIVGTTTTVLPALAALADAADADELLVKTDVYDPEDRHESYELLMNAADRLPHPARQRP